MNRHGITLLEIILVLFLLGVAAQITFLPLRRQVDVLVLRAVREEVVAAFHRARMEARVHGAASLLFVEGEDPLLQLPAGRSPFRVSLRDRGVDLEVSGGREEVEIAYGPLGIASVASATLILRRRDAEAHLVVSGYGRVRR
jgi:hypothetical protein